MLAQCPHKGSVDLRQHPLDALDVTRRADVLPQSPQHVAPPAALPRRQRVEGHGERRGIVLHIAEVWHDALAVCLAGMLVPVRYERWHGRGCEGDSSSGQGVPGRALPHPGIAAGGVGERAGAVWPAPSRAPCLQGGRGAHRWALWPPRLCQPVGRVPTRWHPGGHGEVHGGPSGAMAQALRRHHAPRQAEAGAPGGRRAPLPLAVSGIGFAPQPGSTGGWPWGHVPHQRHAV